MNYDIPEHPEDYVHRIGRTGRMGKSGVARTFITSDDNQFLIEIEKHIGILLEEEIIEGITVATKTEVKRTIADSSEESGRPPTETARGRHSPGPSSPLKRALFMLSYERSHTVAPLAACVPLCFNVGPNSLPGHLAHTWLPMNAEKTMIRLLFILMLCWIHLPAVSVDVLNVTDAEHVLVRYNDLQFTVPLAHVALSKIRRCANKPLIT